MTRWGVLLLVLFFVVGLTGVRTGKAMALTVCATTLLLTIVLAGYMR